MINTHVKKMITPSFIFGFWQGYSGWELLINTLSEKVFQNSFWWSWGFQGFIFDVWPRLLGCQRLINTLIKKVLQNSFWWPWGLPGFIFEVWPGYLGWHFLLNNMIKKILRSSFSWPWAFQPPFSSFGQGAWDDKFTQTQWRSYFFDRRSRGYNNNDNSASLIICRYYNYGFQRSCNKQDPFLVVDVLSSNIYGSK